MQALSNAKVYDWQTWFVGIQRAVVQGGSGAVVAGLANMGIDPEHFNLKGGNGLRDVIELMGTMFLIMGIVHMFIFLQTHGTPDIVQLPPTPAIQPQELKP